MRAAARRSTGVAEARGDTVDVAAARDVAAGAVRAPRRGTACPPPRLRGTATPARRPTPLMGEVERRTESPLAGGPPG
jgi:hypothetical protein